MLALLLQMRLSALINTLRRSDIKKRRRRILSSVGLIIIPLVIMLNTLFMYSALIQQLPDGIDWVRFIFSSTFLGLFLMLLFSGLTVVIHLLFFSQDLSLLISSPFRLRTLFQYKIIDAAFGNSAIFFIVGFPMIIALGLSLHASPGFYFFALLVSFVFIIIPVGLAAALCITLVNIIPAKMVKNISTIVFSLLSLVLWSALQFMRPEQINSNAYNFTPEKLTFLQQKTTFSDFLPSQWLANTLFSYMSADFTAMAFNLGLLIFSSFIFYFLAISFLQNAWRRDLFSSGFRSFRLKTPEDHTLSPLTMSSRPHPSLWLALWQKEIKLLLRDSRHVMQIFLYGVIMIMFPIMGSNREPYREGKLEPYSIYIYLFVFAIMMASGWAARLVPAEGKSFCYSKNAPQRMRRFLTAKIAAATSLTLFCGIVSLLTSYFVFHTPFSIMLRTFITFVAITMGASGIGIYIGASFPNFNWDHPKRMLSGSGNLIYMISFLLLIGFYAIIIMSGIAFIGIDQTIIILLLLSLMIMILGTVLAEKKLDKQEWIY